MVCTILETRLIWLTVALAVYEFISLVVAGVIATVRAVGLSRTWTVVAIENVTVWCNAFYKK